ncbi:hypothetical protein HY970_01105 [Candidatus Kaiserbacteria bacterium]|nr:hypothetical protein [Candidatus Kaiserbacteria bacterium]
MDPDTIKLQEKLDDRFKQLPLVVQNAITSADVEKRLRELAETHKLHLDQWGALENEVMLALLGFQRAEDLAKNIASEVGITAEIAQALAGDISKVVFEPVRAELERELDHPEAQATAQTSVESARTQILAQSSSSDVPKASAIIPATPPQPKPEGKAIRVPVEGYENVASHARKTIDGDPYREQLV